MATTEQEQEEVAPAPKKRRSPLMIGLAVALLVVAGGCTYAMMGHGKASAAGKDGGEAKPAVSQAELYLPLDPAFVVNFRDDESMRYLQIGVTVMAHDQAALDTVKSADPVVRNALVMLFSSQTYAVLSDPAGKQKLQADALQAVRKIVAARTGKPGVDALYFTSFVMQ